MCIYICTYIYICVCKYIYILVYILCHHHHVTLSARIFLTLATPPYRVLLLAGLPGYIQYLYRAAVCMFELDVLPLLVSV